MPVEYSAKAQAWKRMETCTDTPHSDETRVTWMTANQLHWAAGYLANAAEKLAELVLSTAPGSPAYELLTKAQEQFAAAEENVLSVDAEKVLTDINYSGSKLRLADAARKQARAVEQVCIILLQAQAAWAIVMTASEKFTTLAANRKRYAVVKAFFHHGAVRFYVGEHHDFNDSLDGDYVSVAAGPYRVSIKRDMFEANFDIVEC